MVSFRMSRVGCMKRMDSMRKRESRLINSATKRGNLLGRSGRGVTDYGRSTEGASRGSQFFTRVLGNLGSTLGSLAITAATHGLLRFAKGTITAAGRLELLTTGLENVEGSSEAAQRRLSPATNRLDLSFVFCYTLSKLVDRSSNLVLPAPSCENSGKK